MLSRVKRLLSAVLALLCTVLPASALELEFDAVSPLSSFTMSADGSAEKGYTFTVTNPDATVPAFVSFKKFTDKVDAECRMLTFEYRATAPAGQRVLGSLISLNFINASGTGSNRLVHLNTYSTPADSEGWYRMSFDIGAERDKGLGFGRKGQQLWVHFVGIPAGTSITIRNARLEAYEFAQTPTEVSAEKGGFVQASDFNTGLHNGVGHHSRQHADEARVPYSNPAVADRFPILAWCGVEPHVSGSGSIDWDRLEADFKDFWECGFSLAMPTGHPQANAHCIWDNIGRFVFKDTGLKMFLKPNDLTDDEIKYYAGADRLAGWFIRDEPFVFNLHEMRQIVDRVTSFDTKHILYGNIFGAQSDDMSATGARNYEDYVNQYLTQVGIGYLSYDFYPVRQYVATGERFVHPLFFYNLEMASRISQSRGIPFWGFVHSVESNCSVKGTKYPKPSLEEMKIEAFCALAYGAQGIQYFTYGCPYDPEYNYQNSPLDSEGNRTPTWDMVCAVNKEINALRNVFLGARPVWVANTAEKTPQGCRSLTDDMLPDGFTAVRSDNAAGLCVSLLANNGAEYLMVVNPDLSAVQNVTIDRTEACRQVTPDGIIDPKSDTHRLAPGEYVIYLLGENTPANTDTTEPFVNPDTRLTDSRSYYSEVDMRRAASGQATYINNMGTENWGSYSLSPQTAAGLGITPMQAADNWGAWFNYTIDVEADGVYDLRVRHAVPWDSYRRIASSTLPATQAGALCADYRLDFDPTLNWAAEFAASMVLEIDGQCVVPTSQQTYPARPEADDYDGSAYNTMLADKNAWLANNSATLPEPLNATLRFWPRGGDNTPAPRVNDKPDYAAVNLTAGQHTVTVRSLCSPWQFYGIEITPSAASGIDTIVTDTDENTPEQWFDLRGLRVDPATAAPGLYLRKRGTKVEKIAK